MPSSLELTYSDLREEIGFAGGFGRSGWDSTQDADIEIVLKTGLRKFYWPILNPQTGEMYRWSFLEEDFPLKLAPGQYQYGLPERLTRIADPFQYAIQSGLAPMVEVSESAIQSLLATEHASGDPRYFALSGASIVRDGRTARAVLFYPIPATEVVVTGRMEVEPFTLDTDHPYPLGGAIHSETIKAACLAAAEERFYPEQGAGVHAANFVVQLQKSIEYDRGLSKTSDAEIAPDDPFDEGLTTFDVNKKYLKRLIGRAMEFGPHPGLWNHSQLITVNDILRAGLRNFYTPQVLPGEKHAHSWSFLKPSYTLALVAGKYIYPMPPSFVAVRGEVRYAPGTNAYRPVVQVTYPERVLGLLEVSTGAYYGPLMVAFRVSESSGPHGTTWEMLIAPTPSGDERIQIPFEMSPYQLDDEAELPIGGAIHAQTVIESCLAEAERVRGLGENVHQQQFMFRLQSSVSFDRQATCPLTVGVSHDDSDLLGDEIVYGEYHGIDYHLSEYTPGV